MDNPQSLKRPRLHREAWQLLVEELEDSGLNRLEFANGHHIDYHHLGYWQHKLCRESTMDNETSPLFLEVPQTSEAQAANAEWNVELSLGSDVLLRLRAR